MQHIFIPSYHRPHALKTIYYFLKIGWDKTKLHVFIDDEADDREEYIEEAKNIGFNLHIFDMEEARRRFDYVHRPSVSRRSAGQARNMFHDFAKANNIDFAVVIDDDTNNYEYRVGRKYQKATEEQVKKAFNRVEEFMRKRKIGLFGLPQTGDLVGGEAIKLYIRKVMNTTFYYYPYIYRGERGVQDDDTSQFVGVMNEGLFTGSTGMGVTLFQTLSATQRGGLTDLYRENKLLNKSLVTVIQYPSAIIAERRDSNGGRLHHRIYSKYLYPRIIKITDTKRDNIAWDKYPEDIPFTNEPKRK